MNTPPRTSPTESRIPDAPRKHGSQETPEKALWENYYEAVEGYYEAVEGYFDEQALLQALYAWKPELFKRVKKRLY